MELPAAASPPRPLSTIGSASQALITTVHQASTDVTNFVRRCRSARTDLAPVTRELSELLVVLQLLADGNGQGRAASVMPEELQAHLGPIVSNCVAVVAKVQEVLARHETAGWTVEARGEVGELAKLLGVYRGVMGLVSDLICVVVVSSRRGGGEKEQQREQISAVLEELRALGSSLVISYSNAALAREHFALQVHAGQMFTYIETRLAPADLWQDAVKTLDEAQRMAGLDRRQLENACGSASTLVLHAPLIGSNSADRLENGLQQQQQTGTPDKDDPNRPPSLFFTPNNGAAADPKPPATIESSGPSGTGFIVMDGFFNTSAQGTPTSSRTPTCGGLEHSPRHVVAVPGSGGPPPSWKSVKKQNSAAHSVTLSSATNSPSVSPAMHTTRQIAAGLQVQIPNEKELVVGNKTISEEALAFAQVPIHVLDRLSVNLVGHVYGSSPTDNSNRNHSLSTTTTIYEDGEESEASSSSTTKNIGGLRDESLQLAQRDVSELADPCSQPPSGSQTPSGHYYPPHGSVHLPPQSTPDAVDPRAAPQASEYPTTIAHSRPSFTSARSAPLLPSQHGSTPSAGRSGLREVDSMSTMQTINTQSYMSKMKPLPRAPLVYIPGYPGPFIKKKVVVVGNFSCGKTCLITRMARGQFPRSKDDEQRITETLKISVDEAPVELCLWDIRGVDYDPSWLHNAHVALVCFSVNIGSTDSKGKHLGRWVAEVNRNCPGAAILLVGLKADIRFHARSVEKLARTGKAFVTPEQGEQFRENIGATRYVECSARTGEGVQAVLGETARVALQVQRGRHGRKTSFGRRPLSRIGKFFGFTAAGQE